MKGNKTQTGSDAYRCDVGKSINFLFKKNPQLFRINDSLCKSTSKLCFAAWDK